MVDWLYVGSVVVFVIALIIINIIDRKNIKRESIIILRKTQKGKNALKRIGGKFPRGWKFIGMIGIFVTLGASVYGFYLLANIVATAFVVEEPVGGLTFVLPSPTPDLVILPGVLAVPFWHLIISLALLIVVHEGSHGLMAVREKVPIKSLGWGLLLVIPLAFVEPNEKILQKKGNWPQMRVFAAGSFANFIVAGVVLLISFPLLSGLFTASGVGFVGYEEGYPAGAINLTGLIVRINGQDVNTREDLELIMDGIRPNQTIEIITKDYDQERNVVLKTYNLTTAERLDEEGKPTGEAYLGIRGVLDGNEISKYVLPVVFFINPDFRMFFNLNEGLEAYSSVLLFLLSLLGFLYLVNFGVGLVNMLPIKPLDGGRMWEIVFHHFFPEKSGGIMKTLGMITFFLIVAAFVVPNVF